MRRNNCCEIMKRRGEIDLREMQFFYQWRIPLCWQNVWNSLEYRARCVSLSAAHSADCGMSQCNMHSNGD